MTNVNIENETFTRTHGRRDDEEHSKGSTTAGANSLRDEGNGMLVMSGRGRTNRGGMLAKKLRNGKCVWLREFDDEIYAMDVDKEDGYILGAQRDNNTLFRLDYYTGEVEWVNESLSSGNRYEASTLLQDPPNDNNDFWYVGSNGAAATDDTGIFKINPDDGSVISEPGIYIADLARADNGNSGLLNAIDTPSNGKLVYHQTQANNAVLRAVDTNDTEQFTRLMAGRIRQITDGGDGIYVGTTAGIEKWNYDLSSQQWQQDYGEVNRHILEDPNNPDQIFTNRGKLYKSDGTRVYPRYWDAEPKMIDANRWLPNEETHLLDSSGYLAYYGWYDEVGVENLKAPTGYGDINTDLYKFTEFTWTTWRGNNTIYSSANRSNSEWDLIIESAGPYSMGNLLNGSPNEYEDYNQVNNTAAIRGVTSFGACVTTNRFSGYDRSDIVVYHTVMNTVKWYDTENLTYNSYEFPNDTPVSLIADEEGGVYVGTENGRLVHITANKTVDYDIQVTNGYAIMDMYAEYTNPDDYSEQNLYLHGDNELYKINAANGSISWTYTSPTQIHQFTYVRNYDAIYTLEWSDDTANLNFGTNVRKLDLSDGTVVDEWTHFSDYGFNDLEFNGTGRDSFFTAIGTTGQHLLLSGVEERQYIFDEDMNMIFREDRRSNNYNGTIQIDGWEQEIPQEEEKHDGLMAIARGSTDVYSISFLPTIFEFDRKVALRLYDEGSGDYWINGSLERGFQRGDPAPGRSGAQIVLNEGDWMAVDMNNFNINGWYLE